MPVRISQPAASNSGTWSGATKVACADDRPFWSVTASSAPISAGARSASRSSSRGPGAGREGRRDLKLGIIIPPRALPRIGPGVVEDIFALAVALGIGRGDRAGASIGAIDDHRQRLPPRAAPDAARLLRGSTGRRARRTDCAAPAQASQSAAGDRRNAVGDASGDGFAAHRPHSFVTPDLFRGPPCRENCMG